MLVQKHMVHRNDERTYMELEDQMSHLDEYDEPTKAKIVSNNNMLEFLDFITKAI